MLNVIKTGKGHMDRINFVCKYTKYFKNLWKIELKLKIILVKKVFEI